MLIEFAKLEARRVLYFRYQLIVMLMLWALMLGLVGDRFVWAVIPVWVIASQWLFMQIHSDGLQRLRLDAPQYEMYQRIQFVLLALLQHVPMAVLYVLVPQVEPGLGLQLFCCLEVATWLFVALTWLTQQAAQLLLAQLLFIPLIWPFVLVGYAGGVDIVAVNKLFVGIWLILYGVGPKVLRYALRIGATA